MKLEDFLSRDAKTFTKLANFKKKKLNPKVEFANLLTDHKGIVTSEVQLEDFLIRLDIIKDHQDQSVQGIFCRTST